MRTTADFSLRPSAVSDGLFEFEVFCRCHCTHLIPADTDSTDLHQSPLLKMQAEARQRGYESNFPNSEKQIIVHNNKDIGTLWTTNRDSAVHLIDIGILPEFQRKGIGSAVFRALIQCAKSNATSLSLSVEKSNVEAVSFYLRHGCRVVADDGVYLACRHDLSN